ncbi:MAG TPA: SDR family NAD(P)-dependent oxidoreductase [Candidatus Cybelea sp.]|nr:SDR family NAD(P)-dependent oxidoreductase [Candidatus Cybelea sp.]
MSAPSGVIVSGASTGIGAATVALLAGSGYVAFAGVRSESDAQRLRSMHENVRPVFLEVTDEASVAAAIDDVVSSGTPLLGVVGNAGIALGGPLELIPPSELRRQFDVNVVGALALAQAALPYLPSPGGRIVFVGSIAGRLAMPYIAPYSASKFALRALSDALRIELAPAKIFVSLIEAGSVNTPIWRKGRESRDRIAALLGSNARPHYYRALETIMRTTEVEERTGMPAVRVAEAILHALSAAHPRARYVLGSARAASILALLPLRLRDRLLRAVQGF